MATPIEKYLQNVQKRLQIEQKRLDFWASGRTWKSLKIVQDKRFKRPDAVFVLRGDKRARLTYSVMQTGRGKGKKWPPVKELRRWFRKKGLQPQAGQTEEQAVYQIGKTIAEKGDQVRRKKREPLDLEAIINKDLDKLVNQIADDSAQAVIEQIDKRLPVVRESI